MTYKNEALLRQKYDELGSTRRVGKFFGVCNGTIIKWMRIFCIPRNPKLYLYQNNSGRGRLGELYIAGHPYFKRDIFDYGLLDDKASRDLVWKTNKVDVKTSRHTRPVFRIKKKRHEVQYYICLYYKDKINPLIPVEIWIIPSAICSHSGIAPGFTQRESKFTKYRFSLLRGKDFNSKEENSYNREFIKEYSKYLCNKETN